jgi:hypothetical protein
MPDAGGKGDDGSQSRAVSGRRKEATAARVGPTPIPIEPGISNPADRYR